MKGYHSFAFLSSGKDIVYGTNLPGLVNIYIDKSFSDKNNISTIYQLMGRAGRPGRSYHANIFVNTEESVQKLLSMDDNFERENDIEKFFPEFQELYFSDAKKKWKQTVQSIYNDLKKKRQFTSHYHLKEWIVEQNLYFKNRSYHMSDPIIESEWKDLLTEIPEFEKFDGK